MFCRPVDPRYPATSYFGERNRRFGWSMDEVTGFWLPIKRSDGYGQHRGTDFACPIGTIVHAMADGIIIRSRFENAVDDNVGAGLYILQLVMLPGYDSWVLKYSHLKATYVRPGQKVDRYTAMAESGMSGDARMPFVHVDLMDLKHQWRPIPIESDG